MLGRGGSVAFGPLGNMVGSGGSAPGFGRLGKDGIGNMVGSGGSAPSFGNEGMDGSGNDGLGKDGN
ncbi:hypothetical protein Gotri_000529, partial [Gossypium trilobum]|nr:hypothetical protein [Gossypium trilobum]